MNTSKTSNKLSKYTAEEIITIGLDNTQSDDDYKNLGILRFLKLLFPQRFSNEFGRLHYDMAQIFLELYNPSRERRLDKQAYFLVHREAAKSTLASFGFVMWCILLNGHTAYMMRDGKRVKFKIDEKFIMICSETSGSAEDFVSGIKDQLDSRNDLSDIFGEKSPQYVEDNDTRSKDKKWTKTLFKTADGLYVRGLGSGQQVRGRNMGGNRPTLCFVDDMYSENNVKTQVGREKIDKWFNSALLNSLDSINGKCLWLGTLVHPDIVVKDMIKSDNWFGINKPIISPEELQKLIGICKTKDGFTIDREHLKAILPDFKTLSWSDRHTLTYIAQVYKDNAIDKDKADYFYQEFMNQAIAPTSISIKEDTFSPMDMNFYEYRNHTFVSFVEDDIIWSGVVHLTVGVDMAATIKDSSDKSVIMCAGYARVFPKIPGRDYGYGLEKYKRGKIVPVIAECRAGRMDTFAYMERQGVYENCLELYNKYKIKEIIIEANGQQSMTIREIKKRFEEQGIYGVIKEEYVSENKKERINAVLRPIIQRYKKFYCTPGDYIEKLYMETVLLGIGDHDDYPDALEECFKYADEPPTIMPEELSDYEEEEFTQNPNKYDWYTY